MPTNALSLRKISPKLVGDARHTNYHHLFLRKIKLHQQVRGRLMAHLPLPSPLKFSFYQVYGRFKAHLLSPSLLKKYFIKFTGD